MPEQLTACALGWWQHQRDACARLGPALIANRFPAPALMVNIYAARINTGTRAFTMQPNLHRFPRLFTKNPFKSIV
jgi:hypothetical protein